MKCMMILLTLLMFTRLDGHKVWIASDHIVAVQGAGQIGYPNGTLISTVNGDHMTVKENVNQVVRGLRGECEPNQCKSD